MGQWRCSRCAAVHNYSVQKVGSPRWLVLTKCGLELVMTARILSVRKPGRPNYPPFDRYFLGINDLVCFEEFRKLRIFYSCANSITLEALTSWSWTSDWDLFELKTKTGIQYRWQSMDKTGNGKRYHTTWSELICTTRPCTRSPEGCFSRCAVKWQKVTEPVFRALCRGRNLQH